MAYERKYGGFVKPSPHAPGTVLVHDHVVLDPAAAIEQELVKLIRTREGTSGEKVRNYDRGNLDGLIDGLARALVYIDAGSDYVTGDLPRKLVNEIVADVVQERSSA